MKRHPLKSHEIYLMLCRMDAAGIPAGDEEYRLLSGLYRLVCQREQQQLASPSHLPEEGDHA